MHTVELADGTVIELLKYKSFLCNGEKYTVFLDPTVPMEEEDSLPALFILKEQNDGRYSPIEGELALKLLPFLSDLSDGQSHYFGQAESELNIQELDSDD